MYVNCTHPLATCKMLHHLALSTLCDILRYMDDTTITITDETPKFKLTKKQRTTACELLDELLVLTPSVMPNTSLKPCDEAVRDVVRHSLLYLIRLAQSDVENAVDHHLK